MTCSRHDTLNPTIQLSRITGLLSNQGEKSINLYFIRVPLRKKVLKYGTPKPSYVTYPKLELGGLKTEGGHRAGLRLRNRV